MSVAKEVATWSKDPTTKVGAVLVKGSHIISTGYNGLPHGIDDSLVESYGRDFKIKNTIHAERNAIDHAIGSVKGSVMYVTAPPCSVCAAYMIKRGIAVVYAKEVSEEFNIRWKVAETKSILEKANIPLQLI